jgi:hypothetical protein
MHTSLTTGGTCCPGMTWGGLRMAWLYLNAARGTAPPDICCGIPIPEGITNEKQAIQTQL